MHLFLSRKFSLTFFFFGVLVVLIISESNVTLNSQLFILDHKNSQIFLIFWKKKKTIYNLWP